jgi:UDPglucose 6-dehydrogenase
VGVGNGRSRRSLTEVIAETMRVVVFGLWHLGCVTAACVAAAGKRVIGLDVDADVVARLEQGQPPIQEPGLSELIEAGRRAGRLSFTSDAATALADADVLWVTFDTPVDARDEADVASVRARLEAVRGALRPGTLVVISSQVPVGFTRSLAREWADLGLGFAYSPENLRLGKAIGVFQAPERVIVGLEREADRPRTEELFQPYGQRMEWMSVESAEMTKHAINAFLATSVCFINELARICERVGADAREVERGLKSEGRIGPRAYLSPGPAFAGGTLARDLRFLAAFGRDLGVATPLVDGVVASNDAHKGWLRERISALLAGVDGPVVAVLGLTYKPGTDTLRRSSSVELCHWLLARGVRVQAHDPAVRTPRPELDERVVLGATAQEALAGADLAVIATEWPEFRALPPDELMRCMRTPQVVDQTWFLAAALGRAPGIQYFAPGRAGEGTDG